MRDWRFVVLLVLLCASGCSLASDETARKLVDVIVANHLGELGWAIAWRSTLGAVLGLGLGIGTFFAVRQLGGLAWNWEHARWVRALTGTAYGVTFAGALGWFGFWQGTLHGSERVIREGQLATDVLPIVGEAGSTLFAAIYVGGETTCEQGVPIDEQQAALLAARLDGYVANEWQMDVETLRSRLADVRGCVLALAVDEAKRQVYARYPGLEGNLGDDIVPWVLDRLAGYLAKSLAEKEQVAPIVATIARLDEAAADDGDPLLSHRELSDHVVTTAVVPLIMLPIEHVAQTQQRAGLLVMLGIVVLSIAAFQLAHWQTERKRAEAHRTA
jgi:hypothetical protein